MQSGTQESLSARALALVKDLAAAERAAGEDPLADPDAGQVELLRYLLAHGVRALLSRAAPLLVDVDGAAELCGLKRTTWYQLLGQRKIGPAPIALGGRKFWRVAELAKWIEAGCPDAEAWAKIAQRV